MRIEYTSVVLLLLLLSTSHAQAGVDMTLERETHTGYAMSTPTHIDKVKWLDSDSNLTRYYPFNDTIIEHNGSAVYFNLHTDLKIQGDYNISVTYYGAYFFYTNYESSYNDSLVYNNVDFLLSSYQNGTGYWPFYFTYTVYDDVQLNGSLILVFPENIDTNMVRLRASIGCEQRMIICEMADIIFYPLDRKVDFIPPDPVETVTQYEIISTTPDLILVPVFLITIPLVLLLIRQLVVHGFRSD